MNKAADWTEGYVAEIEYTAGVYRELSPIHLHFASLISGHQAPPVDQPFTCFELGCGKGLSANLIAAANPHGKFYANDFNPAHVVFARNLAAEAKLDNITFLEKSFAELGKEDLPDFDYITLHGVYSWVSAENRRAIVDFIRARLKPGGLVYVSYNTLPGWTPVAPLRELMMQYAANQTGPLPQRIKASVDFAQTLAKAKIKFFTANPLAVPKLEHIASQNPNYLAHEYFNKDWTLLYHAELAQDMAAAKLTFAASATISEQFDDLQVKSDVRELYKSISDPVLRETIKDFVINQQFRRDMFVRGAPRLDMRKMLEAASRMRVVLSRARELCGESIKVPAGSVKLSKGHFRLIDALADGPRKISELLSDPAIRALGDASKIVQSIALLVGIGYASPAAVEPIEKAAQKSSRRFNDAILARTAKGDAVNFLASPLLGNAVSVDQMDRLFLDSLRHNRKDIDAYSWDVIRKRGESLAKDGKALKTPEENKAELARLAGNFQKSRLPVFQRLGVA